MTAAVPYENATSGAKARDEITSLLRRMGCEEVGFMDDFAKHEVLLAFRAGDFGLRGRHQMSTTFGASQPPTPSNEFEPGDCRAVYIGGLRLEDGRVLNDVVIEFPAGTQLPVSVCFDGTPLTLTVKRPPVTDTNDPTQRASDEPVTGPWFTPLHNNNIDDDAWYLVQLSAAEGCDSAFTAMRGVALNWHLGRGTTPRPVRAAKLRLDRDE